MDIETLIRVMRVVALVTGTLVTIDSLGILVAPREDPPHRPKWSACAWLLAGGTVAAVAGLLVGRRAGIVGPDSPMIEQQALLVMWLGLAAAFTVRAIARAQRPVWVALSATGMTAAGIVFAGQP